MKYPSRYSNGKNVSAAQYITELICENKAKIDKEDIGLKFWTSKKWTNYYRNQISSANKLLEKYNEQAIIKALKNTKAQRIYSLRAPHLIAIIEEEQSNLETQNKILNQDYDRSSNKKFQTNSRISSKLSRLKELE
jgi:ribosomal protein S25